MKPCKKCKETKPVDSFHKWSLSKDGKADWCKSCRSAHSKKPDIRQADKERYKQWYEANKPKALASSKQWQHDNREKYRANMRKAARKAYAANPLKFINRAHEARIERWAIYDSAENPITEQQWADRLVEFEDCCAYCHKPSERLQQDHIQPISKGGQHTYDNVVPACAFCNASKGSKSLLEFIAYQNNINLTQFQIAA